MLIIEELQKEYVLKGVGKPMYYLDGNVTTLDKPWNNNGIHTALSTGTYISNVVKKFEEVFRGPFCELRHQWTMHTTPN